MDADAIHGAPMRTFDDIKTLSHGGHRSPEDGFCAMEAVAYVAGEPHSDRPACASEVIGTFLRAWNDGLPSSAERDRLLKPLLPLVVGTAASRGVDLARSWLAFDWQVRVLTPAWLDLTPALKEHATALRAMPALAPGFGEAPVHAAWDAARDAARSAAWSAVCDAVRNAARDASRSAASDAAALASGDAACDAVRDAARSAAWSAVGAAAGAAARAAARATLAPTVATLQDSAQDLVRRMCVVDGGRTG